MKTILCIDARHSEDARREPCGSVPIEALVLSLVSSDNGYRTDMLRVRLSVRSDGTLQHSLTIPEQCTNGQTVQAAQIAGKVGETINRIFQAPCESEQERARLVYVAMAIETATRGSNRGNVSVINDVTNCLTGRHFFTDCCAILFEDRLAIIAHENRRLMPA